VPTGSRQSTKLQNGSKRFKSIYDTVKDFDLRLIILFFEKEMHRTTREKTLDEIEKYVEEGSKEC
jgi:hypothetical protein